LKNRRWWTGEVSKTAKCQYRGEYAWKNDEGENSPNWPFAGPEADEIACRYSKNHRKHKCASGVYDESPERARDAIRSDMQRDAPPSQAAQGREADHARQKEQLIWVGGQDGTKEVDGALCQDGFPLAAIMPEGWLLSE
jgi:hypothetical protein